MPRLIMLVPLLITAFLRGSLFAASSQPTIQSLNKIPLAFTQNNGQWDLQVLFRANAGGTTMWFTKDGVTYQFTRRIPSPPSPLPVREGWSQTGVRAVPFDRFDNKRDTAERLILTAKFVGANPSPEVIAEGEMEYKCNYFLGNDSSKWHTDVPNYSAITLKAIYPGIDLKYSGDGSGQVAYEFIAAPGADITQIKVAYEGAEETFLDDEGMLIVRTKWGNMVAAIKSPVYSPRPLGEGSGVRAVLSGRASFSQPSEQTLGFATDRSTRLTTGGSDREGLGTLAVRLSYSTYLGGGEDGSRDVTVDGNGNAYVTGEASSSSFPTSNPFQTDQGGADAFVTKFSSTGNSLIYSTYLGGASEDKAYGIAVDGGGNVYVTGYTQSFNFPIQDPYRTYQGPGSNLDAFVTKLSSSGDILIFSTYLGGGGDEYGYGIAVDDSGNAYVTGSTSSYDFPNMNSYQETFQGGNCDVFVTKFSGSTNDLIYSTYLGGKGDDEAYGIAVNRSGNVYVTGRTNSLDFRTLNSFQETFQGGHFDAFVTKLYSTGDWVSYSTYLGGRGDDAGSGVAVDGNGNAYVIGWTSSSDFPTSNPYQETYQGRVDVFVTKLSNTGTSLSYSTYLGGETSDWGNDIAVDVSGNAYVTGWTTSANFPALNPYQMDQGNRDVFVTKFSNSGNKLIYSTYLGGEGNDEGRGITVDVGGNAYLTGITSSTSFPTLNPYQLSQSGDDAFVTKLHADALVDVSDEIAHFPLPEKPALDQNYPNPFNPSTEIGFDLSKPSFVSLDIYDVLGRKVSTLVNEHLAAGSKRAQWDGRDDTGTEVASGVYFYRLRIGDHVEVKKMVLLK